MPTLTQSSGDLRLDRRYGYAVALEQEGDLAAAADLLRQILDEAPGWAAASLLLGRVAERQGDAGEALRAFEAAAAHDPGGLLGAGLHAARLRGDRDAPALPQAYVTALFDDYAARFDRHLVEGLGYRGPDILCDALDRVSGKRRFTRALDLGCGTGLMGRAIRARVDHLAGVDLSPAMVAEAGRTGVYDALTVGSLEEALAGLPPASLDLALAADVLVYCGALGGPFAGVAAALAPGGLFAFTVQAGTEPVRLGDDLRVSHSEPYLRDTLTAAGLVVEQLEAASTRRDAGHPVPGLVCVASRP